MSILRSLKNGPTRPLFVYFNYFHTQFLQNFFSRIRTRIVGVEGEHADHLTTTTAQTYYKMISMLTTCNTDNVTLVMAGKDLVKVVDLFVDDLVVQVDVKVWRDEVLVLEQLHVQLALVSEELFR